MALGNKICKDDYDSLSDTVAAPRKNTAILTPMFCEPVTELEIMALDDRSEPLKDDPDEPQQYGCVVIGFDLSDSEGCRSILTITADNNRADDEKFAKLIIKGLQA